MIRRILAYTRDKSMLSRDTLLDGKFRITPNTRITAEPPPPLSPSDLGTRHTGGPGPVVKPEDVERMCTGFDNAARLGLLTSAEVAELKARARWMGGFAGSYTSAAGVTTAFDSVKWMRPDGTFEVEISSLTQDDVDDLQRVCAGGGITSPT